MYTVSHSRILDPVTILVSVLLLLPVAPLSQSSATFSLLQVSTSLWNFTETATLYPAIRFPQTFPLIPLTWLSLPTHTTCLIVCKPFSPFHFWVFSIRLPVSKCTTDPGSNVYMFTCTFYISSHTIQLSLRKMKVTEHHGTGLKSELHIYSTQYFTDNSDQSSILLSRKQALEDL